MGKLWRSFELKWRRSKQPKWGKLPTCSCATGRTLVSGSFCRVKAFCPSSPGHHIQERIVSRADCNGKMDKYSITYVGTKQAFLNICPLMDEIFFDYYLQNKLAVKELILKNLHIIQKGTKWYCVNCNRLCLETPVFLQIFLGFSFLHSWRSNIVRTGLSSAYLCNTACVFDWLYPIKFMFYSLIPKGTGSCKYEGHRKNSGKEKQLRGIYFDGYRVDRNLQERDKLQDE